MHLMVMVRFKLQNFNIKCFMSWITNFFNSSVGRKVIMSLSGLFLCLFLVVHMAGNLQLIFADACAFNIYTYDMTHSPLIKFVSYITYLAILLHAIDGIYITLQNRKARPVKYAVTPTQSTWSSRNMALLGMIILFFLVVHLKQFWYEYKFGSLPFVTCEGMSEQIKDIHSIVVEAFKNPVYVGIYLLSLIGLAFHLNHGFQSAFQTLGLNHKKYTPIIKFLGATFAILVPLGFAIQPIYLYITSL